MYDAPVYPDLSGNGKGVMDVIGHRRVPVYDVRRFIGGNGDITFALEALKREEGYGILPDGEYTISRSTDIGSLILEVHPNANITLDSDYSDVNYPVQSTGSVTRLANLSVDAVQYGMTITLQTAPTTNLVGRWLCIQNTVASSWHSARSYYYAGEWVQVAAQSGAVLTLTRPLLHGYAALSTTHVYVATLNAPRIIGGNWNFGATSPFKFTLCTGAIIGDMSATARSNAFLYFDRCVDLDLHVRNIHNVGTGTQDDYGISIGNCHKVDISGGSIYARRHAITLGGGDLPCAVPCRYINTQSLVLMNNPTSGVWCADFHGNAELCEFVDCDIYGGIGLAGKDNGFVRCRVFQQGVTGWCASMTEVWGGNLYADKCTFTSTASAPTANTLFDLGHNSAVFNTSVTRTTNIKFTDTEVIAANLNANVDMFRFTLNGSTATINFVIDGLKMSIPNSTRILRLNRASGTAASDRIIVDNIDGMPVGTSYVLHDTSAYHGFYHRMPLRPYRGALVYCNGTLSAQNYVVPAPITFNAEIRDTDSIHSTSSNTSRLTVPVGVTKVRLRAHVRIDSITADLFVIATIYKNGSTLAYPGIMRRGTEIGATVETLGGSTAVLDVVAGNYFELYLQVETDTSVDIASQEAWFEMEIVE